MASYGKTATSAFLLLAGVALLALAACEDGQGGMDGAAAGDGTAGSAGSVDSAAAGAGAGTAGEDPADSGAGGTETDAGMEPEAPTSKEYVDVYPWFNLYRPEDLSAAEPLPVIVWANGGCFRSDFPWATLHKRWAAAGFLVLALTDSMSDPAASVLTQTTPEHQGALIDWVLNYYEHADKVDAERIVAAGNSCGGITSLALTAQDERVRAVFVLSGSSSVRGTDTAVMSAIKVPVGYVVGGSEDIANPNAHADYDALGADVPAILVSRSSGDHFVLSTDPSVLPEVADIGISWFKLSLYGSEEAADALTSDTVCAGCEPGLWNLMEKNLASLRN